MQNGARTRRVAHARRCGHAVERCTLLVLEAAAASRGAASLHQRHCVECCSCFRWVSCAVGGGRCRVRAAAGAGVDFAGAAGSPHSPQPRVRRDAAEPSDRHRERTRPRALHVGARHPAPEAARIRARRCCSLMLVNCIFLSSYSVSQSQVLSYASHSLAVACLNLASLSHRSSITWVRYVKA